MMAFVDSDFEQFTALNRLCNQPLRYRGINLINVLRNDIGLKMARALRNEGAQQSVWQGAREVSGEAGHFTRLFLDNLKKSIYLFAPIGLKKKVVGTPKVFFYQSTKLPSVAGRLSQNHRLAILSNKRHFADRTVWAPVTTWTDFWMSQRSAANYLPEVVAALHANNIKLLAGDINMLAGDIANAISNINRAFRYLDLYQPDLVVVGGDNFLPPVAIVLAAKQRNIPTLSVQHGLDCERFFHEQIYSDHFCVWGEARAERCRKYSRHQPVTIHVTGCPEFDEIRPVTAPFGRMDKWLWLTRPHEPEKCCEPSRYPDEGAAIFASLLEAFVSFKAERFVIKAHPRDDTQPYRALAARWGLADRVVFVEGRGGVYEPIRDADVVFTEDSTSGMEAMFFGKPIIHTHFSEASPSLPFVEYGAALPGFCLTDINGSLKQLRNAPIELQQKLITGQRRFLDDYAGPLDGHATQRICSVIDGILANSLHKN
jgi:glycosyltransferase involved in cell wall biosynthesis